MFDALVSDVRTAAEAVVPGDVARALTDDELMAGVRDLERARTLLEAVEGVLLVELDLRGTTDARHGLRTTAWVARACGRGPRGGVTARLRVAHRLRGTLRATEAALATGQITWDHARVLTDAANPRIAERLAGEVELELLALARRSTFPRWRTHVQQVIELLDEDGSGPADDLTANRLRLGPMLDGVVQFDGQLVGLSAEAVRQAVERVADELGERYRRDLAATDGAVEMPARPTLRALALVELIRRANAAGDPGRVGPSPEITLTVDAADVETDGTIAQACTPTGARIARGHLCSLTTDLSIFPIVRDSLGVPLDMGREIRTANGHQRRALAARDGGCVFAGCDAHPDRCRAHHVDHWVAEVGRTDVRRMVLLCPHHHGVIHRRGWRLDLDADGWASITTPTGHVVAGQRHHAARAGPAPPLVA